MRAILFQLVFIENLIAIRVRFRFRALPRREWRRVGIGAQFPGFLLHRFVQKVRLGIYETLEEKEEVGERVRKIREGGDGNEQQKMMRYESEALRKGRGATVQ